MDMNTPIWRDSPKRYGLVSRILHWAMAYILLWQFAMILSWKMVGPSPVLETIGAFGPGHGTVGFLTIVLVVVRAIWAFINRNQRPPQEAGLMGKLARIAHLTFYVLLFTIPALALFRAYGSGKGREQWGINIVPATGEKVEWMMAPANALHSPLSWGLCVLIILHILAVLFHRLVLKDNILSCMAGPMRSR
ncbi:cytochrome b [Brucella gallinifaecis]|nr:cytochrome b [Brucella gallinifaecis]